MKSSILGLVLVITLAAAETTMALSVRDSFIHNLWNSFKKSHRKEYLNDEHEQYRFGVFKTNIESIEKHNSEYAMGMHSYSLGVNVFADWTVAEFRQHMFGTKYSNQTSKSSGKFMRLPSSIKAPDAVDWRKEGAVTPVKNQGQCGSCWAFSTTGSLEGQHFRQSGKLVSLSEQQLVDCSSKTGNEGCNGGLMDNAFEYIKENGGLDTEESYPYHAHNEKCHFNKKTIGATCSGYIDVESGDEDALKEAVATVGPVSVAIEVTEDNFMFYKEGVFVDTSCSSSRESLNHGVLVAGYGSNSTMDYWLVKNSWGESWGESGYIRMARNLKNMCGIATAASYPLVK